MSVDDNITLVWRAYDAFGRGDMEELLSLFADDIDWFVAGPATLPTAGARSGREAVAGMFESLGETEDMQEFVAVDFVGSGDDVVAFGRTRSQVKATGKAYETDWAHRFTVRGGSIVRFREYTDTAAAVEAFTAA